MNHIQLRPLRNEDLDAVHRLVSDWNVVRYMLFNLSDRAAAEHFLRDSLAEGEGTPWRSVVRAIIEASSGDLVGMCGIAILGTSEEGELWYLLRPDRWGQGCATEAARLAIQLGFVELGLHRIWATVLPENPASARVLEKVGMRREGAHRRNLKIHGEWKDSFAYAILADEFAGAAG